MGQVEFTQCFQEGSWGPRLLCFNPNACKCKTEQTHHPLCLSLLVNVDAGICRAVFCHLRSLPITQGRFLQAGHWVPVTTFCGQDTQSQSVTGWHSPYDIGRHLVSGRRPLSTAFLLKSTKRDMWPPRDHWSLRHDECGQHGHSPGVPLRAVLTPACPVWSHF